MCWQQAEHQRQQGVLVLEEKEHQRRHEDEVHNNAKQRRQLSDRRLQKPLPKMAEFVLRELRPTGDLLVRDQAGKAGGQMTHAIRQPFHQCRQ